jgi:replicative DNA helicase
MIGTRTVPHSIEAEENLLSLCLLDGTEVLSRCLIGGIRPDSFFVAAHGVLFERMVSLYSEQKPVSIDTVAIELQSRKELDQVGGYSFLTQISKHQPTTVQTQFFINKVREYATLRQTIRACIAAVEECYAPETTIDELMSQIADRVTKATGGGAVESEEPMHVVAAQVLAEVQTPTPEKEQKNLGLSWGLTDLDRYCGRLANGSLAVLAGMPSTGKSALADQVAWSAAATGKQTLIFTYEMTKRDKAIRIGQQISHVNFDDVNDAPMDIRIKFIEAMQMVASCKNLHVFERDTTINRLVARVRSVNQRNPVGFVVVDFIQYLSRLEPRIGTERTDEKIGRMTAALKNVAKEFEIPVLLLSSLNREGYKDGGRPTMASLRSSGEIESDADVVAILHWPEKTRTGAKQDPHDEHQRYFQVEFNQEKGRAKGVHKVDLTFDRRCTRFDNYAP